MNRAPTHRMAISVTHIVLLAGGYFTTALHGQTIVLEPGKTIEQQLADDQSAEYRFTVPAGNYAKVLVDQQSINLAVTLFGPDGKELFASDSSEIGESESADFIAEISGTYRLQLRASEPHALSGRYTVTLKEFESATERHRKFVAANAEFARGMTSYRQGTREAMLTAIAHLGNSVAQWRAAEDLAAEARALVTLALVHAEVGNQQEALEHATQALRVARDSHDRTAEARALDALGQVHHYFGDRRKAIEYYEQALPLMHAKGDRAAEGSTLSNLSVAYSRTGEKRKALAHFDEALHIFRELQDRKMLADVASNMGVTYDDLGEYQKALESHQNSLAIKRERGDRASQAISLNNVGSAYSGLAAYQKALDAYTAALEINRSMDNRRNVSINLNNIAWIYEQLADHQHALTFYRQSLEIVREVNDRQMMAVALNNIAETYTDLGDYRKAVELHQEALPLRRLAADADGEANSLNNLGKAYAKLGQPDKARSNYEQALAKHRASGNRHMMARTLRNLGELNRESRNYDSARPFLDEALEISRAIHDPNGEAAALADLARLERDRGNLSEAHQRADQALAALESLRLAVASPKLRASFFTSARDIQELNIEVLMRLHAERPQDGFAAAALLSSERGRARSLLEMLGEGAAEIRQGVDVALLTRERELEQLIAAKAEVQLRLLGGTHTETDAQAIAKELDTLTADLEQVQARIRGSSPQYVALTQPAPLNVNEIQSKVLDSDTVLLEYSLGTEKSFLWTVAPSTVRVFELPPRAEIESAAKHVYELLTARNQRLPKETPAARAARVRQADADFFAAAAQASRMLVGPAAAQIQNKRLLIVGEGVLQYLPFAALPEPSESPNTEPLAVNHEIVMAPSASVLAILRQETGGRKPAEKAVAVLADPVFSADDARISPPKKISTSLRSVASEGSQEFMRLRFSRAEAEEIARLAPASSTLKALDFDASREMAMSPELGNYRIVHFATHSLLHNRHPELSGVVLSLYDRAGRPQNGFLRLYDVYNLRLSADLVVLSACQTALGEEINGEGLIGLTRGFLYAGAPRVVATLWEIDDRTTAELMKRFYQSTLARGERPAAALRAAQVAMWRTKGWDSPYYWGAFTILGEWR